MLYKKFAMTVFLRSAYVLVLCASRLQLALRLVGICLFFFCFVSGFRLRRKPYAVENCVNMVYVKRNAYWKVVIYVGPRPAKLP